MTRPSRVEAAVWSLLGWGIVVFYVGAGAVVILAALLQPLTALLAMVRR